MNNINDINQEWSPIIQTAGGSMVLDDVNGEFVRYDQGVDIQTNFLREKAFFVFVRLVQMVVYPFVSLLNWWLKTEVNDAHGTLKKERSNVIFAASHFMEIDILLIPSLLGFFSKHFPVRFFTFESKFYKTDIAKGNIFKKFFYGGWLFDICGACVYDRKDKNLPYKSKLAKHIRLLKELNQSLIIFPSGTMEPLGKVTKVLPGTAVLAYYSRRPVVTIKATPSEKITIKSLLSRKIKLVFDVGPALYPNDIFKQSFLDKNIDLLASDSSELLAANNCIYKAFNNQ